MDFASPDTVTLSSFIRDEERKNQSATGELSKVLSAIALGTKVVSQGVNRAGLASMLGMTGEQNVQGESVQKLDIFADQVFDAVLGRSGQFVSMVSEERESVIEAARGDDFSKYVIAFDPLDGSSNIDVNVSIGTIFGIYKRVSSGSKVNKERPKDFFQGGRKQIAAGYTIYGSSTMFVFSTGQGVQGFTLDPSIGEFILTNRDMTIPDNGTVYSCNEANSPGWNDQTKDYVNKLKEKGNCEGEKCSHRYVGSLVADFHRTMLKGGIFLYPGDKKNTEGKLRYLYECAPMAFLAEEAGGKASAGSVDILDIVPDNIHQRSPLIVGSKKMVEEFVSLA